MTDKVENPKLVYYGTTKTEEEAELYITLKVITDEWRILIPPTPALKAHKLESGTLVQQIGMWFMLHRFHRAEELGYHAQDEE